MSLGKTKFFKKEKSKMKKDIGVSQTTEQEIPIFKDLKSELGCQNCKQKCNFDSTNNWKNVSPNSKWQCEKEKRKIKTIETLIFAAIEIVSILIIYFLLKNIFITLFLGVALVGVMIWFDFEKFDKVLSEYYQKLEEQRKTSFEKDVETIKANNECIRRKASGETEEYISFKDKAIKLTRKVFEQKENVFATSYDEEEEKANTIKKLFLNLYNNLNNLTDKISPTTFEYAYIQKFYASHLPSLIESIEMYYSKNENEISLREKCSFEKLLETFDKKIVNVSNALAEQTENEFISKMESLQNEMLGNK